jgi:hypothetical protein
MSILLLLAWAVGLGSFILFIMVLIKQFQTAGPVHGIIGIITCGIWTFIWGWMNAGNLGIKNLMLIWTALWILYIVLLIAGGGMAMLSGGDYGPGYAPR